MPKPTRSTPRVAKPSPRAEGRDASARAGAVVAASGASTAITASAATTAVAAAPAGPSGLVSSAGPPGPAAASPAAVPATLSFERPPAPLRPVDTFVRRHLGPQEAEVEAMLDLLGAPSLDALVDETVPASIRLGRPLALAGLPEDREIGEHEVLQALRGLASQNQVFRSYLGMGYHGCIVPAVIQRNVLQNPGWYTQYTPYQAEISQGRLEALLTFQTMVEDLTGLPVANASMLDEATAAAEAMTMARRAAGRGRIFLADADCLPQTLAVLATRAEPLGIELVVAEITPELVAAQPDGELFGVLLQYPGASGAVRDLAPAIDAVQARGALAAVA